MFFNSLSFAIFLPIIFSLYWILNKRELRSQNILLLVASYFFYSCWDWRFLFLLIFSTFLDYLTAIKMSEAENPKRKNFWFLLSVTINLGFLGFFKYYNFFLTSFTEAISHFGLHANPSTLKIILPVGISFYTFHGLSYVIDIYKNRIKVERSFVDYAVFVSFFPLLVAGPIERATHLLPQIKKKRFFDYSQAIDGLRQILWGLFKKVVIADQCATFANTIFNDSTQYSGGTLIIGAVIFAFQVYGDFSGYSDIALGTARLFGIELLKNFSYPFFSRNIAEFWRRWNISLTSWFTDYVFIPLGRRKGGTWGKIRNTFCVFLLCGFWHGANWTFIVWGLLHAMYFVPQFLINKRRQSLAIVAKGRYLPTIKEFCNMVLTFALVVFAGIFFRSESVPQALNYIIGIFSGPIVPFPSVFPGKVILLIISFMIFEWIQRERHHALCFTGRNIPLIFRWCLYLTLAVLIAAFLGDRNTFIYFQF